MCIIYLGIGCLENDSNDFDENHRHRFFWIHVTVKFNLGVGKPVWFKILKWDLKQWLEIGNRNWSAESHFRQN